jgi:hypothetical protein
MTERKSRGRTVQFDTFAIAINYCMKTVHPFTLVLFGLLGITVFYSCGDGKNRRQANRQSTYTVPADVKTVLNDDQLALGKNIYDAKCRLLSSAGWQRHFTAYPPLASSDYLLSDKKRAVELVQRGSNKVIMVNNVKFKGRMHPQVASVDSAVCCYQLCDEPLRQQCGNLHR